VLLLRKQESRLVSAQAIIWRIEYVEFSYLRSEFPLLLHNTLTCPQDRGCERQVCG